MVLRVSISPRSIQSPLGSKRVRYILILYLVKRLTKQTRETYKHFLPNKFETVRTHDSHWKNQHAHTKKPTYCGLDAARELRVGRQRRKRNGRRYLKKSRNRPVTALRQLTFCTKKGPSFSTEMHNRIFFTQKKNNTENERWSYGKTPRNEYGLFCRRYA